MLQSQGGNFHPPGSIKYPVLGNPPTKTPNYTSGHCAHRAAPVSGAGKMAN